MKLDAFLIKFRKTTQTWNIYLLLVIKGYRYWDKLLSLVFKYTTRCYFRKSPVAIEKIKNPCPYLKYFSDHFGRFSTAKVLIANVTQDPQDILVVNHLLKLAFEHIKSVRVCELVSAEILAKVMAYRNLKENTSIFIPVISSQGDLELAEYVVDIVFDLWNEHIAFGLYSNHPHALPILLFRGTDLSLRSKGGRASLLCDLDPDGPGRRLFHNSQSTLRQWLRQLKEMNKPARVMGHSLGGALAIYTWIYEHSLLSTILPSYSFNPPGISSDLLEQGEEIPKDYLSSLVTFVARGDIVPKFGNLFGEVYEVFTSKPLSPFLAHEQLTFSQPVSYLAQVDTARENASISRKYYSKIYQQSTSLAYRFGLKYLLPKGTC